MVRRCREWLTIGRDGQSLITLRGMAETVKRLQLETCIQEVHIHFRTHTDKPNCSAIHLEGGRGERRGGRGYADH